MKTICSPIYGSAINPIECLAASHVLAHFNDLLVSAAIGIQHRLLVHIMPYSEEGKDEDQKDLPPFELLREAINLHTELFCHLPLIGTRQ